MTDPVPAVRRAILALLNSGGGPQLLGAAVPVWDGVPPDEVPPPVVILDEIELGECQTKDGGPREVLIDVAAVVDGRSRADAEVLSAAIYQRLEFARPVIDGAASSQLRCTFNRTESSGEQGLTHVTRQSWRLLIL
ncbi:DUF3168 domain-containing protein [Sandarakinorhabdus sp.]|uniref:tail completion protein gp17 n=1 Tax=Sandarakinorhabdus sp. TaxID=1916663 RepID=UPI00286E13D1|nr:DUF3168 domain-containing protein [Sandarakinorhabdus sp.]